MVLCRFYQQGTCRYGNSCKYDHQMPGDNRYTNSTSVLLRNVQAQPQQQQHQPLPFQQQHQQHVQQQQLHQQQQQQHQQQRQATNTNIDVNILIKSVVNDMLTAEKGGQWLLSSYAPFKEKSPFPGFEDYSMEEIRFMFYEAVKKNTLEQYKYNLQLLLQQAMLKNKTLQNPSQDIINTLKQLYNSPLTINENPAMPQQNIFGKELQQQQQQQQPQQQSFFSNNTATIQPQQSIFAGGQQSQFQFNQQQPQQQQQQLQPNITQQQANIFQQNFKGGFNNPENNNQIQQQQPTNIFNTSNNNQSNHNDFYSKLDELNDNDKNWFNNDDLIDDLSNIPDKPPTYEMCFFFNS